MKLTLDKDPLYIEIEAEGGNDDAASCARAGGAADSSRSLRGYLRVTADAVKLESKITGKAYHCEGGGGAGPQVEVTDGNDDNDATTDATATDPLPLRYDVHFQVRRCRLTPPSG